MIKTSIIVPLYNRSDLTQVFLSEINPYLNKTNELILIDNNSSDNTVFVVNSFKKQSGKNIRLVSNYENYGFGKANNIGANLANGDNLLFISNDVSINGNFIEIYENNITDDNIYGVRLIDWDTGWNVFRSKDTKETTKPIKYLEGWSIGLRKYLFHFIGGFDENIFIDYDDLNFCKVADIYGYNLIELELPLKHLHPGSSFINMDRLKLTLQSQQYFMNHWNLEKI